MNPLIIKTGIVLLISAAFYFGFRSRNHEQRHNTNSYSNFDEANNQICCVCLCDIDPNSDVIKLPCRHKYHKNCIREVFRYESYNRKICPLCRQHVSESFVQSSF